MVKFKKRKTSLLLILFLSMISFAQQKESLQVQLWRAAIDKDYIHSFGSVKEFIDKKGWKEWEEWEETMNSNVLIDDAANGYLQINRYYEQVTIGAYKDKYGFYTILKNRTFRYFNRSVSSNNNLEKVLPEKFGINNFISDTIDTSSFDSACFYLEADIPRKGTDTQLNLKLVPFGLINKGKILTYQLKEIDDANLFLYGFVNDMLKKLSNEKTLSFLLDKNYDAIISKDKEIINQFITQDSQFEKIDDLRTFLVYLNKIYQLNASVTYKSIILGWNSDKGRFYVKNAIKNDTEKLSFYEFLKNAEYYSAIQ